MLDTISTNMLKRSLVLMYACCSELSRIAAACALCAFLAHVTSLQTARHIVPALTVINLAMLMQADNPSAQDVRVHLAEVRSQILAGTHLVFSHVIPLEQEMTQHHLWRLATLVRAVLRSLHYPGCKDSILNKTMEWPNLPLQVLLDMLPSKAFCVLIKLFS